MASSTALLLLVLIVVNENALGKVLTTRSQVAEGKFAKGHVEEKRVNAAPKLHQRAMKSVAEGVMADYEARVAEYVQQQADYYGVPVDWYDMYGENPVLIENPDYHQYKIDVSVEEVVFSDPIEDITGPGFEYTQWYHNGGSTPITSVFEKTTDVTNTFEWSLDAGVNVKSDEKIKCHVPIIFDWSSNYTMEFDVNVAASKSQSEEETYSIQNTITIPPGRSVEATFTIEENHMVVPWSSDVVIGGWIAIWFVDQVDGHWLWFHPTEATANGEFVKYGDAVKATATGSFFGTKGVDHFLVVKEYPLFPNVTDQPLKVTEFDHHPQRPIRLMHG